MAIQRVPSSSRGSVLPTIPEEQQPQDVFAVAGNALRREGSYNQGPRRNASMGPRTVTQARCMDNMIDAGGAILYFGVIALASYVFLSMKLSK